MRISSLQIGPLRCWPGGLCLSRSIGDMDVGEFIVPVPHVKQVKVGARASCLFIFAEDGFLRAAFRKGFHGERCYLGKEEF